MDYKEKYERSLKIAKDYYKANQKLGDSEENDLLSDIFPELKESEDERIRKALIRFHKSSIDIDGIKGDDILAWLEKQGEQKPANEEMIETIRTEYEKGRADVIAEMQKGWSEEDEYILFHTINDLKFLKDTISIDPKYAINIIDIEREIDWLKSLKDRYTWKPSDEQMKAIHDLNLTGNISYAGQGQVLVELYNDLKNLKEE